MAVAGGEIGDRVDRRKNGVDIWCETMDCECTIRIALDRL